MNQLSSISFGNDNTVLRGYAQTANERLGYVNFLIENTGNIAMVFQLKQYDGVTGPSGYADVGASVQVNARGAKSVAYDLLAKRVGFFGSGIADDVTILGQTRHEASTTANISVVYHNKGDLRGAQIDLVATGRRGWVYDSAFARPELNKAWGTVTPRGPFEDSAGQIDFAAPGV
jgi:hypothetical protein